MNGYESYIHDSYEADVRSTITDEMPLNIFWTENKFIFNELYKTIIQKSTNKNKTKSENENIHRELQFCTICTRLQKCLEFELLKYKLITVLSLYGFIKPNQNEF